MPWHSRYTSFGDGVQQRLGRRALRAEIDQPGEKDARIEEDAHGQRFRSSSIRRRRRRPAEHRVRPSGARPAGGRLDQPGTGRDALQPDAEVVLDHLELGAGVKPGPIADGGGNHHATCLVDGSSHGIRIPFFSIPVTGHDPVLRCRRVNRACPIFGGTMGLWDTGFMRVASRRARAGGCTPLMSGVPCGGALRRGTKPQPLGRDWNAVVSVLAGDGVAEPAGRRGISPAGSRDPFGVAVAADGTVFVADGIGSHRIRAPSPDGRVTTLAGRSEGSGDGVGATPDSIRHRGSPSPLTGQFTSPIPATTRFAGSRATAR